MTEHDARTRTVVSWLREDAHENADRVLINALNEIDHTRQRRSWWPAWRANRMNTYAKLIAAAVAVLVVAVVGYQFLPGDGGIGGQPTIEPSSSPSVLARGDFTVEGRAVELDAAGAGSGVTGSVSATNDDDFTGFTVDLQCTLTTEDGLILIGGDVTDTSTDYAPAGTWAGLVLQRGSPMRGVFVFQLDDPRAASCPAFLEQMIVGSEPDGGLEAYLQPIEGTVELGP
jgi:hypothetical protein